MLVAAKYHFKVTKFLRWSVKASSEEQARKLLGNYFPCGEEKDAVLIGVDMRMVGEE